MDIRAQRTRKALRESLLACLKEKTVKDLQVKEICERAGLDRATFYKHYKGIDDMISELEQEQLNQFRSLFETKDNFGEELINAVFDLIEENKQINAAAKERILSDRIIGKMAEIAKEYTFSAWKEKMPKATDQEVELALTVTISASLQVVMHEMQKYDRQIVIRYINNMINGTLKMYS